MSEPYKSGNLSNNQIKQHHCFIDDCSFTVWRDSKANGLQFQHMGLTMFLPQNLIVAAPTKEYRAWNGDINFIQFMILEWMEDHHLHEWLLE